MRARHTEGTQRQFRPIHGRGQRKRVPQQHHERALAQRRLLLHLACHLHGDARFAHLGKGHVALGVVARKVPAQKVRVCGVGHGRAPLALPFGLRLRRGRRLRRGCRRPRQHGYRWPRSRRRRRRRRSRSKPVARVQQQRMHERLVARRAQPRKDVRVREVRTRRVFKQQRQRRRVVRCQQRVQVRARHAQLGVCHGFRIYKRTAAMCFSSDDALSRCVPCICFATCPRKFSVAASYGIGATLCKA